MKKVVTGICFLFAVSMNGSALPGFSTKLLGGTIGFLTSIVTDSHGVIYYTTQPGDIVRFDAPLSTVVGHVTTNAVGNSGLLGMALVNDTTAVVHYTIPDQIADVISAIDLVTGRESVIHSFIGDGLNGGPVSPEHHGGNPIVAPDGSVFVPIGDGYNQDAAQNPAWNLGKIFRIFPDGRIDRFASGVRNPFDLSWDAARQRLIVPDNGDVGNDEINIAHDGDNLGWPYTMGSDPPYPGTVPPIYVFPMTVAPTGIVALTGKNAILRRGYLLAAFVTKAIYYIPDIDASPLPAPIAVIQQVTDSIIDVTESSQGEIYFGTGHAIYRLNVPLLGDCNADGVVDMKDLDTLNSLLAVHPTEATFATTGVSWGCDVNGDGVIDARDVLALKSLLRMRLRTVRSRH